MKGKFCRLPSMQALLDFEAAARLQSFSRAAAELHMTQSAVSHQIRGLEELLQQPVFRRMGRSVELTDAGVDLLETTHRTLATLSSGINRLDFYTKPGSVVFTCPPAWASHWLLHRLPVLKAQCPELDPWIHTTEETIDFDHSETDCAIWVGDGNWPADLTLKKLYAEQLSPVCSPVYADRFGHLQAPGQLVSADLLHDERWDGWNSWFNAAGLNQPAPVRGLNFSDPGLMLDSALAGHGIALASLPLAGHYLQSGQLLQPFKTTIDTAMGWYLVGKPTRIKRPAAKSFWEWLVAEADDDQV